VWGGSRQILYLLSLVYAGAVAGTSYSVFLFVRGIRTVAFGGMNGCFFEIGNDDLKIDLAVLIFCESLALVLLIFKSVQHAREMKHFERSGSRKSILMVMTEDGIGYFVCTLVISTANLVVLERSSPALRDFLFITQGAIQDILCSRLLFHIQAVNESPDGTFLSRNSRSVPMIKFAPRGRDNHSTSTLTDTFELD